MWFIFFVALPLWILGTILKIPYWILKFIKLEAIAHAYWVIPNLLLMEIEQFSLGPKDFFKHFKERWTVGYKKNGYLSFKRKK
jgi:hypothetical protein